MRVRVRDGQVLAQVTVDVFWTAFVVWLGYVAIVFVGH